MNIILEALTGSRAYNLHNEDSDYDHIGIWVEPIDRFIGVGGFNPKSQTRKNDERNITYHELGKFCALALKCNPTILEVLWAWHFDALTGAAERLIAVRQSFLSELYVRDAYIGYASQQLGRLAKRPDAARYSKHARHCFRLLIQARQLLETGDMDIRVNAMERDLLFRLGDAPPEELTEIYEEEVEDLDGIKSVLPTAPDSDLINDLVLAIRWEHHRGKA